VPDYEHEYVGLIVFYDADGEFSHRCSGSLLTDEVFLTAGHCVTVDDEGTLATSARIYFEQDAGAEYDPALGYDPDTGYPLTGGITASTLYSYGYEGLNKLPQSRDLGLSSSTLPWTRCTPRLTSTPPGAAGTLDTYGSGIDARVDLSGYGVSNPNRNHPVSYRERLMVESFIIGGRNPLFVNEYNVQVASNPGGGRGGLCFGDSGGPVLLADTDIVVAVELVRQERPMRRGRLQLPHRPGGRHRLDPRPRRCGRRRHRDRFDLSHAARVPQRGAPGSSDRGRPSVTASVH
jgi:hypothetical protein